MDEPAVAGDKRRVAQSVMSGGAIVLKASKNSATWWLPLLEAVAHRALTEIRERLEMGRRLFGQERLPNQAEKVDRTGPWKAF